MKKIISIFMIIVALMTIVSFATTSVEPRTVETPTLINETAEQKETNNVLGDNFVLEDKSYTISNQTINGNEFVMVAKKCTIENTTINGNLFIIAENLEIKNSQITGTAFVLTMSADIENSNISDLYIAAQDVNLYENSIINRQARIVGENILLDSTINGNSYIYGNKVEIKDKAVLNGYNKIEYTTEYITTDNAKIENIEVNKKEIENKEETKENKVKSYLSNWLTVLVKTAILVGIAYLFGYNKFNTFVSKNKEGKQLTKLSLKGLLWLILIPIFAIILIFVSLGLLGIISILLVIIYAIFIYFALPLVSFAISLIIKEKYMQKESKFELFGITLITVSALWLLIKFPVLGVLINFIVITLGLGIIIEYILKRKKIAKEENVIIVEKEEK